MKRLTALILVSLLLPAVLMANGQPESTVPAVDTVETAVMDYFASMPDHIYKIGQADFVARVKAGDDMVILDIRQPDVYGEGTCGRRREPPLGNHCAARGSVIPSP